MTKRILADEVQYLFVIEWSDHLHPDITRKVKPPFRWIKLQTENLDTLGDLTLREYGAYCRILNLAALTHNRLAFNPGAIKRRTGVTQKDIEKLQNRGLIEILNESQAAEKSEQNQENDPKTASESQANPPQTAAPEGKEKDGSGFDLNPSPVFPKPSGGARKNFNGEWNELNLALALSAKELGRLDVEEDDDELRELTCKRLGRNVTKSQWAHAVLQVDKQSLHRQ